MTPARMTPAEIICTFMEPRPAPSDSHAATETKWWLWAFTGVVFPREYKWLPRHLDLGLLWEVEERLTKAQWRTYRREFRLIVEREDGGFPLGQRVQAYLHATPAQKMAALAKVLAPVKTAAEIAPCVHDRLNEDGICRRCGADCRR